MVVEEAVAEVGGTPCLLLSGQPLAVAEADETPYLPCREQAWVGEVAVF